VKRLGKKKALVALAHTLIRMIYHILLNKTPYVELGADYLDRFRQDREKQRQDKIIQELEAKGFTIIRTA
jgi:transposase